MDSRAPQDLLQPRMEKVGNVVYAVQYNDTNRRLRLTCQASSTDFRWKIFSPGACVTPSGVMVAANS